MKISDLRDCDYMRTERVWIPLSAVITLPEPARIDEANYKEIMARIDPEFLNQKIRAAALKGIEFAGFNGDEMSFWVRSSEYDTGPRGKNLRYQNAIQFVQWQDVGSDLTMRPIDRARMLMYAGDIRLNCTCPSFLYHGYRYLLDQIDASIVPEKRPPNRTNPNHRGIVCKHMNRTIRSFPFYSGVLAKEIRAQFGATNGRAETSDRKSQLADKIRTDAQAGRPVIDVDFEDIA